MRPSVRTSSFKGVCDGMSCQNSVCNFFVEGGCGEQLQGTRRILGGFTESHCVVCLHVHINVCLCVYIYVWNYVCIYIHTCGRAT